MDFLIQFLIIDNNFNCFLDFVSDCLFYLSHLSCRTVTLARVKTFFVSNCTKINGKIRAIKTRTRKVLKS